VFCRTRPIGIILIACGLGLLLGAILCSAFFTVLLGIAAIAAGVFILIKKPC
jgi:uncharacterized membrane protein HdeD (DUF308 family)